MQFRSTIYLFLFAGFLASCGRSPKDQNILQDTAAVHVTLAQAGNISNSQGINVSGQLMAAQTATISTRMMGYITRMNVQIGDNVQAGQLLFSIKAAEIQAKAGQVTANIAAAEAALANAAKDYERFRILHAQNSATDKELENVALQYKAAQAQVQAARQMHNEVNANMAYANVTAPFSGTITQRMLDAGSLASPGVPVLMLESPGALQAVATLTENQIGVVRTGMQVIISAGSGEKKTAGIISEISHSSVATGGQYLVKIKLSENNGFLPGMYVHISIPSAVSANAPGNLSIPQESLVRQGDLVGVYTVSGDQKAVLRWLRLGNIADGRAEVLSGLAANEKFVLRADGRLWNGARVRL